MSNFLLTASSAASSGEGTSIWPMIILYVVLFGGMYFFLFRPQQKRKKKEAQMRNNLQVGDDITTVGGIVGKVVSIKEDTDTIILETGIDRSKIRIQRWAIASVDTPHDEPVTDKKAEKETKKEKKAEKKAEKESEEKAAEEK